jgi:hypothetical protein
VVLEHHHGRGLPDIIKQGAHPGGAAAQHSAVVQALQLLQEAQSYVATASEALRYSHVGGLHDLQALAARISTADRRASDISALAR